jgi:tetratricopeptide (TPR) repeat protein
LLQRRDPRYRMIIDDVRSYLRFTPVHYDIIATDCTDLRYKTNANLYDYEYFVLCRERITDKGMVVVWMPLAGLSREAFQVALRTFYRAFPLMSVWYMNNEPTHYILIIGTKRPLRIDYTLLRQKLTEPAVRQDLAELSLDDADKLLSCFVTDEQRLHNFLAGDTVNTEDYPYLEFQSPKYGYSDQPIIDNLSALLSVRREPTVILDSATLDRESVLRLRRYYDAVPDIVRGHGLYRNLLMKEACQAYLRAHELNPDDRSVDNLLNFEELRLKVRVQPQNIWAQLALGEVMFLQKRYTDAVSALQRLADMNESEATSPARRAEIVSYKAQALDFIGRSYEAVGQQDRAQEFFNRAALLKPPASH